MSFLQNALLTGVLTTAIAIPFAASAGNHEVTMKSISFEPKVLEIQTGESVTWVNKSHTNHSATAEDGSFDTKMVNPDKSSKAISFEKVGTFSYHCQLHGKTMNGQIVVKEKR